MPDVYEFMHAYYIASDKTDLDEAWADAQSLAVQALRRQMRSIEARIDQVFCATRAEYERVSSMGGV